MGPRRNRRSVRSRTRKNLNETVISSKLVEPEADAAAAAADAGSGRNRASDEDEEKAQRRVGAPASLHRARTCALRNVWSAVAYYARARAFEPEK